MNTEINDIASYFIDFSIFSVCQIQTSVSVSVFQNIRYRFSIFQYTDPWLTHSQCWANRFCAVRWGIITHQCMTSMHWLLRQPNSGLSNFTQVCHESTNITHIWLQIGTIKTPKSKIYSDPSTIILPKNVEHNCWWSFYIYACHFAGLSLNPITALRPTTECKPNRVKLEQIGRWEIKTCV